MGTTEDEMVGWVCCCCFFVLERCFIFVLYIYVCIYICILDIMFLFTDFRWKSFGISFNDKSVFHLCVGENHSYSKLFLRSLPHPGEKVWWLKASWT